MPISFEQYDVEPLDNDASIAAKQRADRIEKLVASKKFRKDIRKAFVRFGKAHTEEIAAGAEIIYYVDPVEREVRFGVANFNRLSAQTLANGGVSFDPSVSTQPIDGYMVADPQHSVITTCPVKYLPAVIEKYMKEHAEFLTLNHQHIGTWYDSEQERFFIDVSEQIMDRDKAYNLGVERGECSIFDVAANEEIQTGGEGTVNEDKNREFDEFVQKLVDTDKKKKKRLRPFRGKKR